MIELAKGSIDVSVPIDEAFAYISNMENYVYWFPGVVSIKPGNDLPIATVGKRYIETLSFPGGESQLTIEVCQCDLNKVFLTKGDLDEVLPQMSVFFTPVADNACHITLKYHSRNTQWTERSDVVVALRSNLATRVEQGLIKLKEILESIN